MRGRNLGTLWDLFGGKYLTTCGAVAATLGIGYSKAEELLEGVEVFILGKGTYYRTLDVIDIVENNFVKGA